MDIIAAQNDLTDLAAALTNVPPLAGFLGDPNSLLTLFAPTNDAIATIADQWALYQAPEFSLHLLDTLLYHVSPGNAFLQADLTDGRVLPTGEGEMEDLIVGITQIGTVLATEAFRNPNITVGAAALIQQFDFRSENGVLHKIGQAVLLPTWAFVDLVGGLQRVESSFSTLIELIVTGGAEATFRAFQNTTLIAPSNAAWAALGTVDELLSPANIASTTAALNYHVVTQVYNFQVAGTTTLPTLLNGASIEATLNQRLFFDGIESTVFFLTQSGYIYQVETVLTPP